MLKIYKIILEVIKHIKTALKVMAKKCIIIAFLTIIIGTLFSANSFSQDQLTAHELFDQGMQYYIHQDYDNASRSFRRSLAADPSYTVARVFLNDIQQKQAPTNRVKSSLDRVEAKRNYSRPSNRVSPNRTFSRSYVKSGIEGNPSYSGPLVLTNETIPEGKRNIISETLNGIELELSFEYMLARGEQGFQVVIGGSKISELEYPIEGPMYIFNGEARFLPWLSVGGRYGMSNFDDTEWTDTDWAFGLEQAKGDCTAETHLFDANLYYRFVDWARDDMDEELRSWLLADNFYADIFAGWQYQKSHFRMTNGRWTFPPPVEPIPGLNSTYDVEYYGPRLGLRVAGSKYDKFSSSLSIAYAWITTKAEGWWNLRDFSFHQEGDGGSALDINFDLFYHPIPNWFLGVGFNYMGWWQDEAKESGSQPGSSYSGWDIIRNVDSEIYGPTFTIGCIW